MLDPTTASRFDVRPPPRQIDFSRLPSTSLLKSLNSHLALHPSTLVRFFSNRGDWTSLKFAEYIPNVRHLLLNNTNIRKPITDLSPLASISELVQLNVTHLANARIAFTPLLRFGKTLIDLSVWFENRIAASSFFDVVPQLKTIKSLGLPFGDLSMLTPLKRIEFLNLGAGPFSNEDAILSLKRIRRVRMQRSRITTLEPYFAPSRLDIVELINMRNCPETLLPSGAEATFVYIDGFASLTSLKNLTTYPRLKTLVIRNCHLPPTEFAFLNTCRRIERAYIEYRSVKQRAAIHDVVRPDIIVDQPVFPDSKPA